MDFVSRKNGRLISLNLRTAVQSQQSKGDGRYDDDDEFGSRAKTGATHFCCSQTYCNEIMKCK